MARLLRDLGCRVDRQDPPSLAGTGQVDFAGRPALNGPLQVEVVDASPDECGYERVKEMRASVCVLGPMLARRGRIVFSVPGGCNIGDRPIDLHLRGLEKLGAAFTRENGYIVGSVPAGRLKGTTLYLGGANGPTVLGTLNVLCAAVLAEGVTRIVGAACEPEVADCCALLNKMGARISGAGSPELMILGVDKLRGVSHTVIPDRIEAGTFMLAAAMTKGHLRLRNCELDHLIAVADILGQAGVRIEVDPETGDVLVDAPDGLRAAEMTTQPYPGFPTDLQAQLMAGLCLAEGASVITERIFPERFRHVGELNRMGGRILKEGATAIVRGAGSSGLQAAPVMCSDLRASAALVLAALAAEGETRLDRVYHIDRGYEKIEQKLQAVGARIDRVSDTPQTETIKRPAVAA
jgi:UDP-N-acetylglucosamine 1-carboxyvinyltransferase